MKATPPAAALRPAVDSGAGTAVPTAGGGEPDARPTPATGRTAASWTVETIEAPPAKKAKVLATVIGIRPGSHGRAPAVDVRLRVENTTGRPIHLLPDSLRLVAANLREFAAPTGVPAGEVRIPAGKSEILAASFPFPTADYPGDFDLGTLTLRFDVRMGERAVAASLTFTRVVFCPYKGFHSLDELYP